MGGKKKQQEVQESDNLLASHNLLYLLKNIRLRGREHTVTRLRDKLLPSLSAGTFQSHSLTFKAYRGQVLLMCFHCGVSSERKVHAVTNRRGVLQYKLAKPVHFAIHQNYAIQQ